MKALKPFGLLGSNDAAGDAARGRARRRAVPQPRGAAQAARRAGRGDCSACATGSSSRKPPPARVQEMFEALEKRLESADTGLSTLVFYHLRALWGDGREIIACWCRTSPRKQEERERKACALEGNRRQFQQRQASEQQLRQAESLHGGGAPAARRRSMRGSPNSTSGGIAGSGPKVAAQRPALQAAVDAAEATLHGARGALRTDREGGRRRVSGNFRRGAGAPSISPPSPAPKCCACGWRAPTLVASARAAMARRESSEYYGDLAACVSIMSDIVKARNLLKQRAGITQEVAQRTERLRGHGGLSGRVSKPCRFRNPAACPKAT